jgi:hypothetical protein
MLHTSIDFGNFEDDWRNDYGGNCNAAQGQLAADVQSLRSTQGAFAALKADGGVVAWGHEDFGGDRDHETGSGTPLCMYDTPKGKSKNNYAYRDGLVRCQVAAEVRCIYSTSGAFAALKEDGTVVTWGHPDCGGDCHEVQDQLARDVKSIVHGNDAAFAAIKSDGSVVAWGNLHAQACLDGVVKDIVTIPQTFVRSLCSRGRRLRPIHYSTTAVLKTDSNVIMSHSYTGEDCYTGPDPGLWIHEEIERSGIFTKGSILFARDVQSIHSTKYAFAALKTDASVLAYGDESRGGDTSKVRDQIASGVESICATNFAFAALKADGAVVAWGSEDYQGTPIKCSQDQLAKDVQYVYSNELAFAAVKFDGSVVAWGHKDFGGDCGELTADTSKPVYSVSTGFAAVTVDGTVVAWGRGANAAKALALKHMPKGGKGKSKGKRGKSKVNAKRWVIKGQHQ